MSVTLITNRKSHKGLLPTSITLNDLERRNSFYFAFFSPKLFVCLAVAGHKTQSYLQQTTVSSRGGSSITTLGASNGGVAGVSEGVPVTGKKLSVIYSNMHFFHIKAAYNHKIFTPDVLLD